MVSSFSPLIYAQDFLDSQKLYLYQERPSHHICLSVHLPACLSVCVPQVDRATQEKQSAIVRAQGEAQSAPKQQQQQQQAQEIKYMY